MIRVRAVARNRVLAVVMVRVRTRALARVRDRVLDMVRARAFGRAMSIQSNLTVLTTWLCRVVTP